jgi:hypothetical protein
LCAGLQTLGLTTIHAMHLSRSGYNDADAFADTPIWSEWDRLADLFPAAKFVLTLRDPESWFVSFKKTLSGCYYNLLRQSENSKGNIGIDRRCYVKVFHGHPIDRDHFLPIFERHKQAVQNRFKGTGRLLTIDVSQEGELARLAEFLKLRPVDFPNVNRLSRVAV